MSAQRFQLVLFDAGLRCGPSSGVKSAGTAAPQVPWAAPRPVSVFNNRNVASQPGRVSDGVWNTTLCAGFSTSAAFSCGDRAVMIVSVHASDQEHAGYLLLACRACACFRLQSSTLASCQSLTASVSHDAVAYGLPDECYVGQGLVQGSKLVVTHARNVNQERGTKQSLRSEKQSSKTQLLK